MNYLNYNGKLYKEGARLVKADSRGLRYGDGLFETLKMEKGRLIYKDAHWDRMWHGMQVLRFVVPRHFTRQKIEQEITALCNRNNCENASRIRLSIIRGDGGLYDALNHVPNYIIQAWPIAEGIGSWNSNGLVAGIYSAVLKSCDILSNLKHNNYLPYLMGALQAKEEKWNDAVILNSMNRVCDTTIANLFLVKDGAIFTPALAEGCVAGVIRKKLLEVLPTLGWQVIENEITRLNLEEADEVFFTNSMYNIRWVQRIGDNVYDNTITKKIYNLFVPTIC